MVKCDVRKSVKQQIRGPKPSTLIQQKCLLFLALSSLSDNINILFILSHKTRTLPKCASALINGILPWFITVTCNFTATFIEFSFGLSNNSENSLSNKPYILVAIVCFSNYKLLGNICC